MELKELLKYAKRYVGHRFARHCVLVVNVTYKGASVYSREITDVMEGKKDELRSRAIVKFKSWCELNGVAVQSIEFSALIRKEGQVLDLGNLLADLTELANSIAIAQGLSSVLEFYTLKK